MRIRNWSIFLSLAALMLAAPVSEAGRKKAKNTPKQPEDYQPIAAEIVGQATVSTVAYERLVELCDGIGHRLSGSAALDKAIKWAAETMEKDGADVRNEPVEVPNGHAVTPV